MKTKADIIDETTVRVLLDKWYDGTATAADEDALTLYFTTSEDIPEDLRADAAVFALPTEKSQSMSEDIPSDLMAQVNGAIIAEKARKRRHAFWYTAASAAACACIAMVLGLSEKNELTPTIGNTYANAVQQPQKTSCEAQTVTPSDIEKAESDTPSEVPTAMAYDDYHDVSDPAEAERIQLEVAALLSRSLNSTGKAAEKAMHNADRLTEQINRSSVKAVAKIINNSISGL